MQDRTVDNLIIGAGISGLTMAYYLKEDYLIIEKEREAGGYCRTIKNDSNYIWDYAGHFYHFKTEKFKNLFLSMIEPEEIVSQKKITKIYYKGKLIDYPFQTNIHQLNKKEFCECLYDLYFKEKKDNYDNFLDMLYSKFGNSIVKKFLQPYNEKLYATDLRTLDKDAMGRFFPYADISEVIGNIKKKSNSSYNDSFLYLKSGTQYFINKLYNKLDPTKILLNEVVCSVNIKDKVAITQTGIRIKYKNLINTSPLNIFLSYFDDEKIEETITKMSYNKVLVLNLGFDKPSKKYNKEHWIYFPEKDLNFYRIGFYNNILDSKNLSVYVEIGFSKNQKIDIENQIKLTLDNMKKIHIIDDQTTVVDRSVVVMDPGYVHINSDTERELTKINNELEKNDVYTIGRYGKWTYCSMEDCMVWSNELAIQLKNK